MSFFNQVSVSNDGSQNLTFHRFLTTTGVAGGTYNAIGDYSSTPTLFYIQPPPGEIYRIARMIVTIEDSGSSVWEDYGNIDGGVSNGVSVYTGISGGAQIVDMTDQVPVTSNVLWGSHCYDVSLNTAGAGDDYVQARWTFQKAGQMIRLDGDANERLVVSLTDDFSTLNQHTFKVDGYIESNTT